MNWLSDYVKTDGTDIKTYCDRMTDSGSKVESYEILGDDIKNVVVARIKSIEKHPDSDHLQICQMDVGTGEDIQIVTGASNIFEGAIVPAAIPVATLPGGVTIKAGKLRGVPSNGMLCSFGELGLTSHDMPGKEENGILILEESFAPMIGKDIREALLLSDQVVEFEITSNRPDCLSVIGLARETAVTFGKDFKAPAIKVRGTGDGDDVSNYLSVAVEAPDLCYRYMAKVVKNVKIEPSPLWLRMRLRAAGVRPINNIVDITNYVMLEYGQPMHAFDYKQLEGSAIRVRRAGDGEKFRSLDDIDHVLDSSMLVIADEKKACALAGVMGGANSEIVDTTATVVFESACFNGTSVRVTGKKNGMRTESSSRFEKGLDPENCYAGLMRACEMVEMLGAGDVVDGMIDEYPTKPEQVVLPYEPERYNKFLGTELAETEMKSILEKLECKIEDGKIYVPSFRGDLLCMQDIAEEIGRIHGYNSIPSTCIRSETVTGKRTPKQAFEVALERAMYGMGVDQIQTFSFISPKYYDKIRLPEDSGLRKSIVISNPLGEDTSVMRTTTVPSMMEILMHNYNYSNQNVRLFEIGNVYLPNEDSELLPEERKVLTVGAYGDTDFYGMKGICENVLALAGIRNACFTAVTDDPTYHPGRCARILTADGTDLGIFGQIHPLTAKNYGIDEPVYVAALDFEAIWDNANMQKDFTPLPKFPATTRDYSFVCDEEVEVGGVEAVMSKAAGKLVEKIEVFDIYRGQQIGEGKKSVSLRVTLRASDRTLTVEEVDKVSAKIVKDLQFKMGIGLRG